MAAENDRLSGPGCERLGIVLRRPCNLEACRYHVRNEHSHNCALVHLRGRTGPIGSQELALLEGCSPQEVDQRLTTARRQVQTWVIRDDISPRWTRVPGCCVACGSALDADQTLHCSNECADEMPRWRAILEARFGVPAEQAVREVVTRVGRAAAEQVLGLSAVGIAAIVPPRAEPKILTVEARTKDPVEIPTLARHRDRVVRRWGRPRLDIAGLLQ